MLQKICANDLSLIRIWRNEENVRKAMFTSHEIEEEEHFSWWNRIKNDETQKWFLYYYQGKKTGVVSFTDVDKNNISWGFYLANDIKPKKYKMEIWKSLEAEAIRYAFHNLKAKKLIAKVLKGNRVVIKMHQRFNFEIISEEMILKNGELLDVIAMELIY